MWLATTARNKRISHTIDGLQTFLAGVGILSDAYNLFIINLVKQVMGAIYEQSEGATSAISTAALVGMWH
jgi:hypothetical protein